MLDRVCMVWACLLEESLKVVCWRPCLALTTMRGGCNAPHVGVICLIIAIIVIVDHGLNPLRAPLMPLLATLGASLVILDFSIEWCHVAVAWSRLPTVWDREELGCLLAGAVLGGYVVHLLGGVPKNVVWRLERQWLLCVTHIAFGCFRP
jgi:hypothetical protein